jgi:hypothetical protein
MQRSGPFTSQGSLAFGSQLLDRQRQSASHDAPSATRVPLFKKRAPGHPGLFRSNEAYRDRTCRAEQLSVGAAVTAAKERPEPIVETNFEHLNLAARRESVSSERPRSKREVIEFEKVIFKLCRPISP